MVNYTVRHADKDGADISPVGLANSFHFGQEVAREEGNALYRIVHSNVPRAGVTAFAVKEGIESVIEDANILIDKDARFTLPNWPEGEKVAQVGGEQKAYEMQVDKDGECLYERAATEAEAILERIFNAEVIINIGHDPALSFFLYAAGVVDEDHETLGFLEGFTYKRHYGPNQEEYLQIGFRGTDYLILLHDIQEIANGVTEPLDRALTFTQVMAGANRRAEERRRAEESSES